MADRVCRAVGLDVHGVLVERQVEDVELHPERVVEVAHKNAARCYVLAVRHVMKAQPTGVSPEKLWEAEQRAFEKVQRDFKAQRGGRGRMLHHRELLIAVNVATIELFDPQFAASLHDESKMRIARQMRRYRRRHHAGVPFTSYPDVRALLAWMDDGFGAPVHLVTGLERENLATLIASCGMGDEVRAHTKRTFCANDVRANKLSQRFWKTILGRLNLEPHEFVMIGNEVSIDASCTEVGIPAIIFDRGGLRKQYYRSRGASRYDIPYLDLGDPLPPRAPFIGFAVTTAEVRKWLEQFAVQRALPLPDLPPAPPEPPNA